MSRISKMGMGESGDDPLKRIKMRLRFGFEANIRFSIVTLSLSPLRTLETITSSHETPFKLHMNRFAVYVSVSVFNDCLCMEMQMRFNSIS